MSTEKPVPGPASTNDITNDGGSAASRYAPLWDRGRPNLEEFLRQNPALDGDDELAALLRLDQRNRWRAGERVPAEYYLRILEERSSDAEAAVDLIFQEYLLREQAGAPPAVEELSARFPAYADVLRAQIELHQAVAGETADEVIGSSSATADASLVGQSDQLPPSLGRYEIVRCLGRGAMGAVYLARDSALDRQVAFKVPHLGPESPGSAQRFRREAMAAATLHHPNLCPIFDVGTIDGIDYLTMPYIAGETLAARIRRRGALPPIEALTIACQIAEAMEVAHQAGVIHRDLKPANILFNEQDQPVVVDFGLARRGGPTDSALTNPGTVMGTPAYMPPEQVGCDPAALGPAGDIFSLGVVLYEMLTGRVPFRGSTATVLTQVLTEPPPSLDLHRSGLDPRLETICLRAMAKKPAERFASMAKFAADLKSLIEPDTERPIAMLRPRHASWRRASMIALALVVIVGIGYWIWSAWSNYGGSQLRGADAFAVGSVWEGHFTFLPTERNTAAPVELAIIGRNGRQFRGTYLTEGKYRWEVAGEAADGTVRWSLLKPLNDAAREVDSKDARVEGRFADRRLTATYTDANSSARVELRFRE